MIPAPMVDMNTKLDSMTATRILIVDDNPAMREAIAMIIENTADLSICGEARNISESLEQCEALHPDLALVDLSLKGEDGLDLIRRLGKCAPAVRCVVFSLHDEPYYIDGAREAGAQGYVVKSSGPGELLACLRSVRDNHNSFASPGQP